MGNITTPQKVLVILGPTASGKSDLAVKLAKKFHGEIISADSRQVYRGLNIGTGKITKREMRGVRHHLLDVATPKKQFTVAQFIEKGRRAVSDPARRGRLPIICGGTGFYISALLGNEMISEVPPNLVLRRKLVGKDSDKLFTLLKKLNPDRARTMNESDRRNPRRLIRAIEIAQYKKGRRAITSWSAGTDRKRAKLPPPSNQYETFFIGLKVPSDELKERIHIRLLKRLAQGMITEAKRLHANGLSWKRMEELGLEYRYLARFLQGKLSKQEMAEKLNTEIWHYARRQMTWFRRDKSIRWFSLSQEKAVQKETARFLTKRAA